MLRSIVAVLAGVVVALALVMILAYVTSFLAGVPPASPATPLYLALNLVAGAIAGAAGGATAGHFAPHAPHGHVWALAFVLLLLSLPTMLATPNPGQPAWYGIALSVVGPVSVLLGGIAAMRMRLRKRPAEV